MSIRRVLSLVVFFAAANLTAAEVFVDLPAGGANVFTPRSVVINVGDTVTWRNPAGGDNHGVQADGGAFTFAPAVGPWTFSHLFGSAGVFPYFCQVHGAPNGVAMAGIVYVGRPVRPVLERILQLNAWDFEAIDNAQAALTGAPTFPQYSRQATVVSPSGFADLIASVRLPSGASINAIELSACDNDAAADIGASVWFCRDPNGNCNLDGFTTTSGAPGCVLTMGGMQHTMDNIGDATVVRVRLPDSRQVAFRTVRLYYSEPVSYAPAVATFSDVPPNHIFFRWIEALSKSGITAGCASPPLQFCPDQTVTRGQMAVFLARALGLYWGN